MMGTGVFANPPGSPVRRGMPRDYASFFARQVSALGKRPAPPAGHIVPRQEALDQIRVLQDADSITWLGHAAFYFRFGGVGILVDPFLSRVAGPGPFGPSRYAGPELDLGDLAGVDVVLLTHNHYDHFDAPTLKRLGRARPPAVAVPLRLGPAVRRLGFPAPREVNWGDSFTHGDVRVTAVPAIHWSKRGIRDENQTLWCGYIIEWDSHRVYFSGDTAYGPAFEEMGNRMGEFDLGIVGIGAYMPRAVMEAVHADPEEAIQIARDMRCRRVLGMHWGTIVLSEEDPWEPPVRFRAAGAKAGYRDEDVWLMRIGETRPLLNSTPQF